MTVCVDVEVGWEVREVRMLCCGLSMRLGGMGEGFVR